MIVLAPTVPYFNTFYFIAFYTVIYCIIYTIIYNIGFAHAKARVQQEQKQEQDASVPPPSSVSDPVLQAQENEYGLQEELDDEQAHADENNHKHYTPSHYNHTHWPSPRPVNFVQAIIQAEPEFKIYGPRLTHASAVDILAQRAYMSRREFLMTNPLSYSDRYMRGMNALYLLKDSIDMLENILRNESYKQELRRIENGYRMYPRY